jgi:hypothetical protein
VACGVEAGGINYLASYLRHQTKLTLSSPPLLISPLISCSATVFASLVLSGSSVMVLIIFGIVISPKWERILLIIASEEKVCYLAVSLREVTGWGLEVSSHFEYHPDSDYREMCLGTYIVPGCPGQRVAEYKVLKKKTHRN